MSYSHSSYGFGYDTAEMLADINGYGQCTAWADLLVNVLGAQGIAAGQWRISAPVFALADGTPPNGEFVVRDMPAQGTGTNNYNQMTASSAFTRWS